MVTTRTPGGSDGAISASFAFTRLTTSSALAADPHDHHAAHRLALPVPLGDAGAEVGADGHLATSATRIGRPPAAAPTATWAMSSTPRK